MTLENSVDRAILDRRHAVETEIRRTTIEGIVAVGAMVSLVVPEEVVTELGLRHAGARTIVVHADEHREERPVAGPVTIEIGGRATHTDCIVGARGSEFLIGGDDTTDAARPRRAAASGFGRLVDVTSVIRPAASPTVGPLFDLAVYSAEVQPALDPLEAPSR